MSFTKCYKLSDINEMNCERFETLFRNVIEHCQDAASYAVSRRPFVTIAVLKTTFALYLDNLNDNEKKEILNNHPDLKCKLDAIKDLTEDSKNEQKSVGLDRMSMKDRNKLATYNDMYKKKFDFPFVICVHENAIDTILESIQERLKNSVNEELNTGIEEVKKICYFRIDNIVSYNK